MTTTALYIDPDVLGQNIIKSSLRDTVVVVSKLEDVLNLTGINRVGLMYINDSKTTIPYLRGDDKLDRKNPAYAKRQYYSNNFVKYLIDLKTKFGTVTFDLITCSMNNAEFLKETKEVSTLTNVQIESSLNQTGNGITADWILESNGENLKETYFTDSINEWKYVLDVNIITNYTDALDAFNNIWGTSGTLTYNTTTRTYKLLKNVTVTNDNGYFYPHLQLNNEEIFDGNGFIITQNYNSSGFFVFNSSTTDTTVKNLTVTKGSDYYINHGGIVKNNQRNFTVINCTNTGSARSSYIGVGGIVGDGCNNFKVIKCTNDGDFSECYTDGDTENGGCGGIVGTECYNYTADSCVNNGSIGSFDPNVTNNSDQYYCGGICGSANYNAIIKKCINNGTISCYGGGGIVGGYFALEDDNDTVITTHSDIDRCVNNGQINVDASASTDYVSAGIAGNDLGYIYFGDDDTEITNYFTEKSVTINECNNNHRSGTASHGICASWVGELRANAPYKYNYKILIKNCKTVEGSICGEFTMRNMSDYNVSGIKLIIDNCKTKTKSYICSSVAGPSSADEITYITAKGSKINLLKHPKYHLDD